MRRNFTYLILMFSVIGLASCNFSQPSGPETPENPGTETPENPTKTLNLDKVLENMQKNDQGFTGKLEISIEDASNFQMIDEVVSTVTIYNNKDLVYLNEYDETTTYADVTFYKNSEGYAANRYLSSMNELVEVVYNDGEKDVVFDEYFYRPFDKLTKDNLSTTDSDDEIVITNFSGHIKEISFGLTTYRDIPIDYISLKIDENNEVVSGSLSGNETLTVEGQDYIVETSYEFETITFNDLNLNILEEQPHEASHDKLGSLFNELKKGNYSMKIVRTGGLLGNLATTSEVIYTDSLILRKVLNRAGEVTSAYGIYKDGDNGICDVDLVDNVLIGRNTPNIYLTMDAFRTSFELAPEMFEVIDENTFRLKSGDPFDSFVTLCAPDLLYSQSYLYNYKSGSLVITLTDTGATYYYEDSYVDAGGSTVEGQMTLEITNIGTTTYDYKYENYSIEDVGKWSDYTDEVVLNTLTRYFGENYDEILPFIDGSQYYDWRNWETREYAAGSGEFYGWYFINTRDVMNTNILVSTYTGQLENYGWKKVSDDGTYNYVSDDGTTYRVRVYAVNDVYFYMWADEPIKS